MFIDTVISLSMLSLQESSGGKTQMASLFSCILVLVAIFILGPYLESLPNSVLGAVILVAIVPLYKQVRDIKPYWKLNKTDCAIWYIYAINVLLINYFTEFNINLKVPKL